MKNKLIAAIDLGTTKIVCLVGEMTQAGIKIIGLSQRPSKGIRRGEVMNIQQTFNSILPVVNEIQESLNIRLNEVFVGIAGQNIRCVSNAYQVNRKDPNELISEEEIAEITENMSHSSFSSDEEVLHIIPQSYNIDDFPDITEPVGMPGNQIAANFKIFVGKKNSSVYTANVINRAGLKLNQIILEPMASARAVLSDEEMELGVAMVDIGGGTTDLLIIQDNVVRHAAVIPFGGNSITDDIKMGCCISEKNAEQLKTEHGYCYSQLAPDKKSVFINGIGDRVGKEITVKLLSNIIEARVSELLEAVYYEIERSGYKDQLKAGLVITGGSSKLTNIKELAELITGMDTNIGYPVNNVMNGTERVIEDPALSTAVGLVLMGADKYEKTGYPEISALMSEENEMLNDIENNAVETKETEKFEAQETVLVEAGEALVKEQANIDKKNKGLGSFFKKVTNSFGDIFEADDEA